MTGATDPGDADPVLEGRYRLAGDISPSTRGNLHRATDLTTGRAVVIKQARTLIGEVDGAGSWMRLRNERRILTACPGIPGTPDYLDSFAHGLDEYLVTAEVGKLNLLQRVRIGGSYLGAGVRPTALAEFARLAAELARTLRALHDRGVVVRDVTPANIVLGEDRAYIVHFGISALDGVHLPGGTPAFAPASQLRDAPPAPPDDCYSLGMVLAFAATGLMPLVGAATPELARRRAMQGLAAVCGDACPALVGIVDDLLSPDADAALRALWVLAAGGWAGRAPARDAAAVVALPPVTLHTLEALERRALDLVLDHIEERLFDGWESGTGPVDATVYTGSAGIGLELLHHRHRDGVPEVLRLLAAHAASAARRVDLPPGLLAGVTGVELFLARMAAAGYRVRTGVPSVDDGTDPGDDAMSGLASIGQGELLLYDVDGDQAHLDAARVLAERILDRPKPKWTAEPYAGLPREAGVDPTFGYAYGLSGVVDFLVGAAARTGDLDLALASHRYAHRLAGRAPERVAAAARATALPMAASWCRGLAGAARALQHAATFLDDSELGRMALAVAMACAAWLPRMENLSQCCGATGVGSALVEVAAGSGDERPWEAARHTVRHLLVRSLGPDERPVFIEPRAQEAPLSWGMGGTGILAFLRRVNHPDTPDLLACAPKR